MDYPVKTIDGAAYTGPPGLEALLSDSAPSYGTELDLPITDGRGNDFGTGRFVYAYTALATLVPGGACHLDFTGYTGTAGYYGPMATVPATTSSMPHLMGIVCSQTMAAGGIWVQTKGVNLFARITSSALALGSHLQLTNGARYLTVDHATVGTVDTCAIYMGCRLGAAGATAWTKGVWAATTEFETLDAYPFYHIAANLAYGSQGDTTNADPACMIYLPGKSCMLS